MKIPTLPAHAPKHALVKDLFSSFQDRGEDFDPGISAKEISPFAHSSVSIAPRSEWGGFHAGTIGGAHLHTLDFQIAAPELFLGHSHSVAAPAAAHLHAPAALHTALKAVPFHGTLGVTVSAAPPPPPEMISGTQIAALKDGLESTLTSIASNLVSQVFADTLPLLGNQLSAAPTSGATQLAYVTTLKDTIVTKLSTLSGDLTEMQFESALNTALTGFGTANLDLSNPSDIKLSFITAKTLAALTVPLDSHIGLPGFGLETTGAAQSTLGYTFSFSTGLDATGFYLSTAPGATNFHIIADTRLPTFTADAELGPLKFTATDNAATPTLFHADFTVALKDGQNSDGHLRPGPNGTPGELADDFLDATLSGNAKIDLKLSTHLGDGAALPNIGTDLSVNWGFNTATVDPGVGIANFGNRPTIEFKNISNIEIGEPTDIIDPENL